MKARGDNNMIKHYEEMTTEELLAYAYGASEARINSTKQPDLDFSLVDLLINIPEEMSNNSQQKKRFIEGYEEVVREIRGDKK